MNNVTPYSLEAERSVLGGLMLENSHWAEVSNILTVDDFYDSKNQLLFKEIAKVANNNEPFDMLRISEKLKDAGKLQSAGGDYYILSIAHSTPSAVNTPVYAKVVKEKSEQRKLAGTATAMQQAVSQGNIELAKQCIARAQEITDANKKWQEPIPLIPATNTTTLAYPVDLLPDIIRGAVEEYAAYGQQPTSIIACSALANVSLVCQGLANVARDTSLISHLSLYFVVVAESGERKTAADKIFTAGVKSWEQLAKDNLSGDIKIQKAALDAWQARREGILAALKRPKLSDLNIEELKHKLREVDLQEPPKVFLPSLYHEETNAETLAYNLALGWQSSSLWSDEAGIVVGGHGMNQENITKFTTLLNRLWDGNSYRVDRKTSESFTIEWRRLTCSLMMQPSIFEQLLNRCSSVSRGSGFLARCLITNPPSTMGSRFYKELPAQTSQLNNFYARINQLLEQPLPLDDRRRLTPKLLHLNKEAKALWIGFHDKVEAELRTVGEFHEIKDFAAKAAENASRLAGNFHIFCQQAGEMVDTATMQRAIGIMAWHLSESKRLIEAAAVSQEYKDAQLLLDWLKEKQRKEWKINEILKFAPISLRTREKRDQAVEMLQQHHYLTVEKRGSAQLLILNPSLWK